VPPERPVDRPLDVSDEGPCCELGASSTSTRASQGARTAASTRRQSFTSGRSKQTTLEPGIASPVRILEPGLKLRATHIVLVGLWASSAGFVMFAAMWMYLAVGFGVLIAFNVLVLAVVAVAARHIEPREELRPAQRARLITYVR
jgi:hypothetical protein